MAAASAEEAIPGSDLLIVGPGVLGSLVGSQWLEKNQGARVVGQTNTTSRHEDLKALGIEPRLKTECGEEQFTNVIFCAPPSGSDDYTGEIVAASKLWNGTGTFMFTSSSAVYSESPDKLYTEESETVPAGASPRVDRLLEAETAVLEANGCVVRLAGLYTAQRGAHMYYLKVKEVPSRGDALLNLIHYEDAASLCTAVLSSGRKGQVFMGCDNNPVAKAAMMEAVYATNKFGTDTVNFGKPEGSLGRRMNNQWTRDTLHWEPKYSSFKAFAEAYGRGEADF